MELKFFSLTPFFNFHNYILVLNVEITKSRMKLCVVMYEKNMPTSASFFINFEIQIWSGLEKNQNQ